MKKSMNPVVVIVVLAATVGICVWIMFRLTYVEPLTAPPPHTPKTGNMRPTDKSGPMGPVPAKADGRPAAEGSEATDAAAEEAPKDEPTDRDTGPDGLEEPSDDVETPADS